MLFSLISRVSIPRDPPRPSAFLVAHDWDDGFEFQTRFALIIFDAQGERHTPGQLKIGEFGLRGAPRGNSAAGVRAPTVPATFDILPEQLFSLGQDENYYETLNQLEEPLRQRIINGLRDTAHDIALFDRALAERVTTVSLLREVREDTVRKKLSRLVRGDARLTRFDFAYAYPPREGAPPVVTARSC